MKKTIKSGLVGLLLGVSGLGLGITGYNYLKDEELILSPIQVQISENKQDNKQNKQTASKQEDYQQKKNSEKTGLKTEQETRKKSETSKPLPEPFEPDEKYLSEEYQRKVREESDEIMRREKDYINSQSNENTNFPVGKDDIEIRNTDNPKAGEDIARNLEEYVKKALDNPDARVVEHKKQKDKTESETKGIQPYPLDILDDINSSGRMPTKDYKNEKFMYDNFGVSYGELLEDILGGTKTKTRFEDNPKKGQVRVDKEGRKFVASDKVLVEYMIIPTTFITNSYKDNNKNGVIELDEILQPKNNKFKNNEKILLGIYLPERTDKVKTGTIELYNQRGKRVLESNFKIDDELEKGEVDLKELVRKNGCGIYTAVFYVNDKCWEVRPIEIYNSVDFKIGGLF